MSQPNPSTKPEGASQEPLCYLCGAHSDQRVLLPCVSGSAQQWVCVRCLPALIHGSH
ncbi:MAG: hypothetical protein AAB270_01795 [Chloroflexota bacterium]